MRCNPATSTNSTAGPRCWWTSCATRPLLRDVTSDQQTRGLQTNVVVDRDAAARLGVSPVAIDNTLYDAFGQRQVSTMYTAIQPAPRRPRSRAGACNSTRRR